MKTTILENYNRNKRAYEEFGSKLDLLIKDFCKKNNNIHSITHRIKDQVSLEKKIERKLGKYSSISDVTDIVGIRIITKYAEDVDDVAKLIEKEFNVDKENSIDKRKMLDPDRFGYLSFHYVVSLGDNRKKLTEYQHFSNLKAEVQIRSIIQHAWAEIEHDLGYKSEESIPNSLKREFSRLAALLELADAEFTRIKRSRDEYISELDVKINNDNNNAIAIEINRDSLRYFIENEKLVSVLDNKVLASIGNKTPLSSEFLEYDLFTRFLKKVGFENISEIRTYIATYQISIIEFAKVYLSSIDAEKVFPQGIILLYAGYYKIAGSQDEDYVRTILDYCSIGDKNERVSLSSEMVSIYKNLA
jgi:putative GTP pyrophosphokinase